MILSFIQKKKSLPFVEKIFRKLIHIRDPSWTTKRFYLCHHKLKDKINLSVVEDTLDLLNQFNDPDCAVYSQAKQ